MFNFTASSNFPSVSFRGPNFVPQLRSTDTRHNPYVGTFCRRSNNRRSNHSNLLPSTSPHVGTFRHAPVSTKGLKEILWEQENITNPFLSQIQLSRKNQFSDRHIDPMALDNDSIFQVSPNVKDAEDDKPNCAICLDDFQDGDEIRVLDCDHCFHKSCIDTWLLGTLSEESTFTSVCPTCKRIVVPSTPSSPSSSLLSAPFQDYDEYDIPSSSFIDLGALLHLAEGCMKTPSPSSTPPLPNDIYYHHPPHHIDSTSILFSSHPPPRQHKHQDHCPRPGVSLPNCLLDHHHAGNPNNGSNDVPPLLSFD